MFISTTPDVLTHTSYEESRVLRTLGAKDLLVRGALYDAGLDDLDLLDGAAAIGGVGLNLAHNVHSLEDTSENDVLVVEPGRLDGGDEEF